MLCTHRDKLYLYLESNTYRVLNFLHITITCYTLNKALIVKHCFFLKRCTCDFVHQNLYQSVFAIGVHM